MPSHEVRGARLQYEDDGAGEAVLFLQGVGVSRRAWRPQTEVLSRGRRCLAIDHRGMGGSEGSLEGLSVDVMARDAVALVEALGLGRVHVVGHSLGGVVAQRFALLAPERARSLSLLCTFVGGRDLSRPSARLVWLGALSRFGTRGMRRRAFARLVSSPSRVRALGVDAVVCELEGVFGRALGDPAVQAIADRQLAALRAHDERGRLGELSAVPALVCSGGRDPIAEPAFGRALAAGLAGATYREWEDASHALPIQQAEEVNAALAAHFDAVERRG